MRHIDSAILIALAVLIWVLSGCVMPDGSTMELDASALGAETVIVKQETDEVVQEAASTEGERTDALNAESSAQSPSIVEESSPATIFISQGIAFGEVGDLVQALAEFDKAVEADPDNATAFYFRGMTHAFLDDLDAALSDLDRAVELEPRYAQAYLARGQTYGISGNLEQAIQNFEQVIELNTDFVENAYFLRGIAFGQFGDHVRAIQDLKMYIELAPDAPDRQQVEDLIVGLGSQQFRPAAQPSFAHSGQEPEQGEEFLGHPILHFDIVDEDGKEELVWVVTSPDGRSVGTLINARWPVWSPDGTRFALFTPETDGRLASLHMMNLDGEAESLVEFPGSERIVAWRPTWSPDGRKLAVILETYFGYSAVVIDVAKKEILSRYPIPAGTITLPYHMSPRDNFRWSPDGKKILVSWENAVVIDTEKNRVVPISDQHVVAEWSPDSDAVYYVAIANLDRPSGRALEGLYYRKLDSREATKLADADTLIEQGLTMHPGIHYARMMLSPSTSRLVIVGGTETDSGASLHFYDVSTEKPLALNSPSRIINVDKSVAKLEWAPNEDSVAAVTVDDEGIVALELLELATGEWKTLVQLGLNLERHGIDAIELLGTVNLSWTQ